MTPHLVIARKILDENHDHCFHGSIFFKYANEAGTPRSYFLNDIRVVNKVLQKVFLCLAFLFDLIIRESSLVNILLNLLNLLY